MATMVFVNFPVSDVQQSTEFYEKLGFKKNEDFSTEEASSMVWDDNFWIMLLNHEFYSKFIKDKKIADAHTTSGVLVSFSLESADAVKQFGETAKANGGDFYKVDMGMPEDQMFGLEVQDLDGNTLEPTWMQM
ncbi:VOC family protein [Enterococcus termitis]|uniref:Glyoxalase n=1 Tax=Enterococcus termitis TaxID=332950 RepID=A0A1E5GHP9_9ENTE|nr:VOC family protein [Enterococcus termitis]OEG12238.1 glyoxalase [Enterococcus termitis]OJG98952.1 glyoxalase [Enterococcus termitis]